MFRGYWSFILAVAGLILLGSSKAPQPSAKAEQQQSQAKHADAAPDAKTVPAQTSEQVQAAKDRQPCGNSRYRSDDDLCAQWKAADAARDAANWAWWQLGLSALGVLGLGMTLWFNFRALKLAEGASEETKDALAIAERNAEAVTRQVMATEEIAKRQLRAYVEFASVHISNFHAGGVPVLLVAIKNVGKTPAHRYRSVVTTWATDGNPHEAKCRFGDVVKPFTSLGPGVEESVILKQGMIFTEQDMAKIDSGGFTIMAAGIVSYNDIFGDHHRTIFCVCGDTKNRNTANGVLMMRPTNRGNISN